ncbi:MAG TPA: nuclear transport factor 2 family protein [Chitinophagaceae bacterium]|jgi:ketosteroid isomerase-like protein|nr:nuclear transport factor 2 family protein [Chitinophagaceae bacterium]
MKGLYLLFFFLPLLHENASAQSKAETAIKKILQHQVDAWNKGDLESFMQGYWHNDSLMYIGKSGITYGYEKTLATYKKNYGDRTKMGQFTSTIKHIKWISSDACFVVGSWYLKRTIGDASGYYSLLFRKINGEWVIVADHSS